MVEKFSLKKIPRPKRPSKVFKKVSKSKINNLWQYRNFGPDESLVITEALINSVGEGMILVDEYGYISHVNQLALDILGFDREDLESKWLQDVLPGFDINGNPIPADERLLATAFVTGQPVSDTINYRRKDGSLVPVLNTSSPFIVKDKPMGGIVVFRDVSKELQVERAKDEFVSLASHQLRTPLTSIRFFAELLKDPFYGKLTKRQASYLDKILFSTDRMISLVSELLNISRLNLGRLEIQPVKTNLNNFVQNQIIEVTPMAKKSRVKLIFINKIDKSETTMIDRTLLSQVIHNLLTNAIRYCAASNPGEVTLKLNKNVKSYLISVSDNGIGIPKAASPRIYDRFFRAENAKQTEVEGTGLGLYLVKSIVESSGGGIRHESKEGIGTTFRITLPLSGMSAVDKD